MDTENRSRRHPADDDLVTILEISDVALLPVVKSLLEDAGIPHLLQGERAFSFLPLPHTPVGSLKAPFRVLVLVPAPHADAARELLQIEPIGDEPDTDQSSLQDM